MQVICLNDMSLALYCRLTLSCMAKKQLLLWKLYTSINLLHYHVILHSTSPISKTKLSYSTCAKLWLFKDGCYSAIGPGFMSAPHFLLPQYTVLYPQTRLLLQCILFHPFFCCWFIFLSVSLVDPSNFWDKRIIWVWITE